MTNEVTPSPDPIVALLERSSHPHVRQLRDDLEANPDLFADFVAEAFWLKRRGRPGAGKDVAQWFRKRSRFKIGDRGIALLTRIALLRYPKLNNGLFELRRCLADSILGTTLAPGKKGRIVVASEELVRELAALPPAPPARIGKRITTRRVKVTGRQAAETYPYIRGLIAGSPHPKCKRFRQWDHHALTQPEIFVRILKGLKKVLAEPRKRFSIRGEVAHSKKTAMRDRDRGKRFTMSGKIACLYQLAGLRLFPGLAGWTPFTEHRQGRKSNRALVLLNCFLEDRATGGRPFRRVFWRRDSDSVSEALEAPAQGRLFSEKKTEAQ